MNLLLDPTPVHKIRLPGQYTTASHISNDRSLELSAPKFPQKAEHQSNEKSAVEIKQEKRRKVRILRSFRLSYRSSSSSSSRSPSSSLAIPCVCTTLGISADVNEKINLAPSPAYVSPLIAHIGRVRRGKKWRCDLTCVRARRRDRISLLIGDIDFVVALSAGRAAAQFIYSGGVLGRCRICIGQYLRVIVIQVVTWALIICMMGFSGMGNVGFGCFFGTRVLRFGVVVGWYGWKCGADVLSDVVCCESFGFLLFCIYENERIHEKAEGFGTEKVRFKNEKYLWDLVFWRRTWWLYRECDNLTPSGGLFLQ